MNIYFAGPIRAGRENQAMLQAAIRELKRHGNVLTEHVGTVTESGESVPSEQIYHRDCGWILQAQLLVADTSTPSTGVGYEIAFAEAHSIPVVCLYYAASVKQMSGMIEGNPNCKKIIYHDEKDLQAQLRAIIQKNIFALKK